jgi:hypothetical protein
LSQHIFIQVIQGKAKDPGELERQDEVPTGPRSIAKGYLGSTGGITRDCRTITPGCFE